MRKSPCRVRICFDSEALTHFGGLYLLASFFRRLHLRRWLHDAVRFRRWNTKYPSSEEVFAVLYPLLLGLGRIETSRLLRQNGAFQRLTGLNPYPDPSTLRRFLTRLGQSGLKGWIRLHDRWYTGFLTRKSVIWDLDTTVLTVYGRQEGTEVGFNPKKRGRPSFQPLLCFEAGSGICWEEIWLPGDAHPLPYTIPLLQRAWAKLPAKARRVSVSADPAFYDQKLLGFVEGKRGFYVIAVRLTRDIKHRLEGLRYRAYRSGLEAAAFSYRPVTWTCARRFVVIRRALPEEPSQQLHLFTLRGYSYQVLVTNLPWQPINVWKFYNGRSTAELVIRELKGGCAVGKIPRHDWHANLAYFRLVLFAYNLLLWFKHLYLPRNLQRISVQTLRNRFLWVPALLVRPYGVPTLRLPRSYPYPDEFRSILRSIERRRLSIPWTRTIRSCPQPPKCRLVISRKNAHVSGYSTSGIVQTMGGSSGICGC